VPQAGHGLTPVQAFADLSKSRNVPSARHLRPFAPPAARTAAGA
jgi:hypothetical protein